MVAAAAAEAVAWVVAAVVGFAVLAAFALVGVPVVSAVAGVAVLRGRAGVPPVPVVVGLVGGSPAR
jgi:hypothetical protein